MTGVAIRRGIAKLSIFVTGGAIIRDGRMRAGQWVKGVVIKCTWSPARIGGMAGSTICGKA